MKKLLLILALVSGLFAVNPMIDMEKSVRGHFIEIIVKNNTWNKGSNWFGLYKKGDSNDWENVIKWSWAKDIGPILVGDNYYLGFGYENIPEGEYELRFFLNNSYTTEQYQAFTINKQDVEPRIELAGGGHVMPQFSFNFQATATGKDSWIGIYNADMDNKWENVLLWSWVPENFEEGQIITESLPVGHYQARLFFHNSYKMETFYPFSVSAIDRPDHETTVVRDGEIIYSDDAPLGIEMITQAFPYSSKDWFGVYPEGAPHTLDNLIAWAYVLKYQYERFKPHPLTFYKKNLLVKNQKTACDVIYFLDDTYKQFGKTAKVTINYQPKEVNDRKIFEDELYSSIRPMGEKLDDIFIILHAALPENHSNDWVGMFPKGSAHTKGNLVAQSHVYSLRQGHYLTLKILNEEEIKVRDYDLVYFKNNSYVQYGKTGEFRIRP